MLADATFLLQLRLIKMCGTQWYQYKTGIP
jgi:hypothetical protein